MVCSSHDDQEPKEEDHDKMRVIQWTYVFKLQVAPQF